jgi:hypothetical protein
MSDRVLNPTVEPNFFSDNAELPQDFWERYFALQKMATMAAWHDGSFSVTFTDAKTGKTKKLKNVRFTAEADAKLN